MNIKQKLVKAESYLKRNILKDFQPSVNDSDEQLKIIIKQNQLLTIMKDKETSINSSTEKFSKCLSESISSFNFITHQYELLKSFSQCNWNMLHDDSLYTIYTKKYKSLKQSSINENNQHLKASLIEDGNKLILTKMHQILDNHYNYFDYLKRELDKQKNIVRMMMTEKSINSDSRLDPNPPPNAIHHPIDLFTISTKRNPIRNSSKRLDDKMNMVKSIFHGRRRRKSKTDEQEREESIYSEIDNPSHVHSITKKTRLNRDITISERRHMAVMSGNNGHFFIDSSSSSTAKRDYVYAKVQKPTLSKTPELMLSRSIDYVSSPSVDVLKSPRIPESIKPRLKIPLSKSESVDKLEYVNLKVVSKMTDRKPPFPVRALFRYQAKNNDELTFEKDAHLIVLPWENPKDEEEGWFYGMISGTEKKGLFPQNYVDL